VGLSTHVEDVVAAIACEELSNVILVGHSYAGMVITGVAERLSGVIAHLVYLDAILPLPGESWSDQQSAEVVESRVKAAAASGGLSLPAPDPEVFGLVGEDREWVARRQTPHPFATYQEKLSFDFERWAKFPRSYIDCQKPALASINGSRERMRGQSGWEVVVLEAGHDPMVQCPSDLAAALHRLATPAGRDR
jgi:pimeloyl-ACP methyl ester carboxylesterase